MVHEKNKSGDPDYDDKVPLDQHAGGQMVKSEDGREVFVSDVVGPVDEFGAHANLDGPSAEDLDNRPAPGGQATEASTVQTYKPEDTAPGKAAQDNVKSVADYRKEQAGEVEQAQAVDSPAAAEDQTQGAPKPARRNPSAK